MPIDGQLSGINLLSAIYEVWLKSNGTGRPADMVEDPQTSETHNINL